MSREVVILKLGGSLLTDKKGRARARSKVIARLAEEIAQTRPAMAEALILGHGSGSFGHYAAAEHGLSSSAPPRDPARLPRGMAKTREAAAELHRRVVAALLEAGEAPFSIAPSSALVTRAGKVASFALEPLVRASELGLLPVVYGDVVLDREWGGAIASTETVVLALVRRLRRRGFTVRRLLWLGETEGVYDSSGTTIPVIDTGSHRELRRRISGASGIDVTGGMLHRLDTARALARLGAESWILDGRVPGRLAEALLGHEVPGTRFLS